MVKRLNITVSDEAGTRLSELQQELEMNQDNAIDFLILHAKVKKAKKVE